MSAFCLVEKVVVEPADKPDTAPATASSLASAFCLVEKVVVEPADKPDTVQIWGACALSRSDAPYQPLGPAARGYLYFFLPAGKTAVVRTEWADLQKVAGQPVGVSFGDRMQNIPRLRPASEKPRNPDEYTVNTGLVRFGASPLLTELTQVLKGK